jgi:hypothetical protein
MVTQVYNGKGQFIGTVNDGGHCGYASSKNGTRLGHFTRTNGGDAGMTYDKNNRPYGKGNLLEALVHADAANSW